MWHDSSRSSFINQDDSLNYRLVAHRTLPQDTVKVTVSVTMLVGANQTDQASLQVRIRDALTRFIPDCNWVFSVLERDTHAVAGYERLNLQAAARIPSGQNYNLFRRAQLASYEGLSISNPQVNYDLPAQVVDRVVAGLRMEILQQVQNEAREYGYATGRNWRIGFINFGMDEDYHVTVKGASRSPDSEDLEVDDCVDGLSGAQQIGLAAEVCLRADSKITDAEYAHELVCIK